MSDGFFVAGLAADVAAGDRVIVTDQEAFHASVVRRLTLGEQVTVTDGMGRGIQGLVVTSTRNQVEVEVTSVLPNHRIHGGSQSPRPSPRLAGESWPST
ncbi:MAG: hypothetical protein FWF43_06305 [Propionibacteriaceae bacterium]|nr:hypothetical protein [Propionibacteriaceae bacterium]